jgi:hypothetical protein
MTFLKSKVQGLKSKVFWAARKPGFLFAAVLFAVGTADAVTPDSNPYRGIIDRNVFALKEIPPPPPPNPDANKPPAPPIQLVGITTLLGTPRAFLSVQLPAKGQEPAKALSLMLTENQRDGEVECIKIDVENKTVLVSNYGSQTNLSFEKNGVKGSSSGGSGPAPATAAATMPAHTGGFTPGGMGTKSIPTSIPTRMVRLPGSYTANPNPAGMENPGGSPAAFTPGSGALTTGATFTPGAPIQQPQQQAENNENLTPAQREILMEAAHQAAVQKGDPTAALYPPSFLNPTRNLAPPDPQNPQNPQNPALPNNTFRKPGSF